MPTLNKMVAGVFKDTKLGEYLNADTENGERHLPRFARVFVRRVERFVELAPPMRAGSGSLLSIGFIALGLFVGAVSGGHGPAMFAGAGKAVGLTATDIVITGQIETTEQDVFSVLGLSETRSLVGFDAEEARARIIDLPWVDDVAIRKLYPGQLLVAIREKEAFAVWQHNDHLSVVQKDGAMISRFGIADLISNRFAGLSHLVGKGAAEHATEILPVAANHPELAQRISAYVRVADRRWDIEFHSGVRAKLPEHDLGSAIARLSKLQAENQLLDRQVETVDLRIADRVTLKLSAEAADSRAKFVADRQKAMKKAEQKL